jgi:hypothetical protein
MPRDDFARLERRWRARPLFLPRRKRLPWWALVTTVLVVLVAALTSSLLGPKPMELLVESLGGAVSAKADPSASPAGGSGGARATVDTRLASPDGR